MPALSLKPSSASAHRDPALLDEGCSQKGALHARERDAYTTIGKENSGTSIAAMPASVERACTRRIARAPAPRSYRVKKPSVQDTGAHTNTRTVRVITVSAAMRAGTTRKSTLITARVVGVR